MTIEYMDAQKVGNMPLDVKLVDDFIKYFEALDLQKTHDIAGDESSDDPYDGVSNPYFNKYIIHDDIYMRFFQTKEDYEYFLKEVIHTSLFPPPGNKKEEHVIDLRNYFEYQRKHLEVFHDIRSRNFAEDPTLMSTLQ